MPFIKPPGTELSLVDAVGSAEYMILWDLSHLPCLVQLNRTLKRSPLWCGSFGQVWTRQSHLGVNQNNLDLDFVEEVVCPVRLRYEHNPTEGNTLLFSRLPWSAFKCVIGCNWISVWRLILYEMSPPVVDREPSSGSYNASTGTFYSCVSQITIGKYTLF